MGDGDGPPSPAGQGPGTSAERGGEARFRALVEATSQIVWTTNANGEVQEDSPTWRAFTGQSFDQMRGLGGFDAIHPDDRPGVLDRWRQAVAKREPMAIEFRLRHASGDWRWTAVRAIPLLDGDGAVHGWVGMHSDISEQKQAERAQAHLAAIVASSNDPIVSMTLGGMVTSWNRAAERLFGYTSADMIGQPILRLISPRLHEEEHAIFARIAAGEKIEHYATQRIARGGEHIEVSLTLSPVVDSGGAIVGISKVVRDITERRRGELALHESSERLQLADQQLRHSRAQLALITNAVPALISYIDRHYRYQLANQTYDRWFGISAAQMEDKLVSEVLGTAAWERVHPYMARALAGEVVTFEQELPYRAGGPRWVRATYTPDRGGDGEVRGFAVMVYDIGDAKQYEAELERLNASLEQRVGQRTREAEQRAWQLRTLAAELTTAEHRERRRIAELLHDSVQQMLVAAKMRLGMVQSRVAGESVASQQVKMASELIDQAIQESRSLTSELSPPVLYDAGLAAALNWLGRWMNEQHGLIVNVDAREVEPASQDIALLLFQAVRELLFNITKHAKVGEAKVLLHRVDGQARIVVEDGGVGFDAGRIDRIAGDAGFGLLTVRERLSFIGGRMDIESAPGHGTRVILLAPAMAAAPAAPAGAAGAADGWPVKIDQQGAVRVLVVDDHAIVRQGLVGLLRACPDLQVVGEAADGLAAVEAAGRLQPDVVVMDVNMPVMNGIEATGRITRELPGVAVIGVSMHTEEDMAASMRRAGAVAYVRKDSPSDTLVGAIRRAMAGRLAGAAQPRQGGSN